MLHPDLGGHHQRQMDDIDPVGCVGDIAPYGTVSGEEGQGQTHGGEDRGIDPQAEGGGRQGLRLRIGQGRQLRRRPARRHHRHGARADGQTQIGRGPAPDPLQQVAPPVQQHAEAEGHTKPDQGGRIGDQAGIRGRHAEEGDPVRMQPQGQGQRRAQNKRSPRPDQPRRDPVDRPSPASRTIQRRERQTQHQQTRIEDQQHPQEPQVGQRNSRHGEGRRRRRIGGRQVHPHADPDHHGDDPRHGQRPEHDQRPRDPDQPIDDKAADAATLQHHMGEQAGDQEEGRHAEQVDDEEQTAGPDRALIVGDDPDLGRKEGHGAVQHHPQQQGPAPQRVEPVKTLGTIDFGCRHENPSLVDKVISHRLV